MTQKVFVRWMIKRDRLELVRILRNCKSSLTAKDIMSKTSRRCIGMVAERDKVLEGFVVYETCFPERKIRIEDIAIADKGDLYSVGTAILEKIVSKLSDDRFTHCEIDVPLSLAEFFSEHGFYAVCEEGDLVRMQHWVDDRIPQFRYRHVAAARDA